MSKLEAVEICAGAGGQVLGLERAGIAHRLVVELDPNACATLAANAGHLKGDCKIAQGDVADPEVWKPGDYEGIDLLAGGVPCPPFTIAGKQLGATDERDLFAWAVEVAGDVRPRALLLENVRGLSMNRFTGYRQHVLDRLRELGYVAEWRLLHASDFGVPQLRPRFVLVALQEQWAPYFHWPEPESLRFTVGDTLREDMGAGGWEGADTWADNAQDIAPTIVGGSKKHGGADLGPTRAKRAWAELGVDAMGVADAPPAKGATFGKAPGPKLTTEMVALLQGFREDWGWQFTGRKTSRYRQIGNAFPPPVAKAVGERIVAALTKKAPVRELVPVADHDPIYRALRDKGDFMTPAEIRRATGLSLQPAELEQRVTLLGRDFQIEKKISATTVRYKLGEFKAFIGQQDHDRHDLFLRNRAKIS